MALTELQIRNSRPQAGKTGRLFEARGLYLEISETGRTWAAIRTIVAGLHPTIFATFAIRTPALSIRETAVCLRS
jgi:hypothetical protein